MTYLLFVPLFPDGVSDTSSWLLLNIILLWQLAQFCNSWIATDVVTSAILCRRLVGMFYPPLPLSNRYLSVVISDSCFVTDVEDVRLFFCHFSAKKPSHFTSSLR